MYKLFHCLMAVTTLTHAALGQLTVGAGIPIEPGMGMQPPPGMIPNLPIPDGMEMPSSPPTGDTPESKDGGPRFKAQVMDLGGPAPNLTGVLEPNFLLTEAERYKVNQLKGPESFVIENGHIYTGLADGRIVDISDCGVRTIATLSPPNCSGEEECGRPLGMRMDGQGRLVVADTALGIFRIDVFTGDVEKLFDTKTPVGGRRCRFINDVAVAADGTIFFTDSSSRWTRREFLYVVLEGDTSGRLLAYSDSLKKALVVQEGLSFPNGLQLAPDDSYILIAEANRARIIKLSFGNNGDPSWRKLSLFAGNLPGLPDNIRISPRGTYWVAMSQARHDNMTSLVDDYAEMPEMRDMAVMMSSIDQLLEMSPKYGMVVELDAMGNILRTLQDPTGQRVAAVSEVQEYDDYLYLGSFDKHYVSRVALTKSFHVDRFISRIKSTCRAKKINLERLRKILKRIVAIAKFRRTLIEAKRRREERERLGLAPLEENTITTTTRPTPGVTAFATSNNNNDMNNMNNMNNNMNNNNINNNNNNMNNIPVTNQAQVPTTTTQAMMLGMPETQGQAQGQAAQDSAPQLPSSNSGAVATNAPTTTVAAPTSSTSNSLGGVATASATATPSTTTPPTTTRLLLAKTVPPATSASTAAAGGVATSVSSSTPSLTGL